mmetsp:Transcript_331/g.596  ORF Transcript_331/g.596 Transcript_331/m.596 type:complete len:89 (+) Transcript_331:1180-1446(+)
MRFMTDAFAARTRNFALWDTHNVLRPLNVVWMGDMRMNADSMILVSAEGIYSAGFGVPIWISVVVFWCERVWTVDQVRTLVGDELMDT